MAFLIDLAIGDPRCIPHPVVLIGRGVSALEKLLYPRERNGVRERTAGIALVVITVVVVYGVGWVVIGSAYRLSVWVGHAVAIWLVSSCLATRGLARAGIDVFRALMAEDLPLAREKLGKMVGRDTERLPEREVIRGAVESIAENTVDAVVSPLFYAILGGPPLALAYKAINTMDSMIGYRDERYVNFGWAAARLDDIANYVPARIAGVLLSLAAGLGALLWNRPRSELPREVRPVVRGMRETWRIMRRDGRKHPSPNGGIVEAAMAGALGVRLGGTNYYCGVPSFRPHLGDPKVVHVPHHIRLAVGLSCLTSFFAVAIGLAISSAIGMMSG